jgi:uncharacterized protein YcbX
MQARVSHCTVYPLKACAGVAVPSLRIGANGQIAGDRTWVVVDEAGQVTWQGAVPGLARVHPLLQQDAVFLQAAGGGERIALPAAGESPCEVSFWNDERKQTERLAAWDAGARVAEFVSDIAGARLRVVRPASMQHRLHPLHLVTLPSWQVLQARIGAGAQGAAHLRRYRPNLVLDHGDDELLPFAEESLSALLLHGTSATPVRLDVYARCIRCVVPNVHPDTGAVDPAFLEATAALSTQRLPGAPVGFGMYARPSGACEIAQGDRLTLDIAFA